MTMQYTERLGLTVLPMTTLFTILFDGVAYGMLLFVLACGLAVTLGLMNFVNLAHGAFAHGRRLCLRGAGQHAGWPFFAALPLAFVASAAIGAVLERTLYRHLYTRSHLDQVLFTDRPHLHVGGGGGLHHGLLAHLHQAAGGAGRASSISSASASAAIG